MSGLKYIPALLPIVVVVPWLATKTGAFDATCAAIALFLSGWNVARRWHRWGI